MPVRSSATGRSLDFLCDEDGCPGGGWDSIFDRVPSFRREVVLTLRRHGPRQSRNRAGFGWKPHKDLAAMKAAGEIKRVEQGR